MCASLCRPSSPTPSAAPSVPQSPGTAPGAPTGKTVPAGPIYLTSPGNIAYTYAEGTFWMYWLERPGGQQWKPSALLAERYAKTNRGHEMRSPAQWLAEYAASHDFKEITRKEFDTMCETGIAPIGAAAATTGGTAALEPQQEEIQTTPADADGGSGRLCPVDASTPATGGPTTQDLAGTATGQAMPSFDYSGYSLKTVDTLHMAERMIREARRDYILKTAQAVALAHEELCSTDVRNSDTGRFEAPEASFLAWCRSVGVSKSTAYQLLQVNALMENSSPEELAVLKSAGPSLLYAAAKPSAPAELVQAVKDGEITTHKEYQALLAQLKAERERAADAEERAQAAQRSAELDAQEVQRLDKLAAHYKAENDRRAADQQRLEGLNATLAQEMAEKTARIQELEARPVEVTGATEKEIARWKAEGAKAERDKAQRERDKAAVREAALRKELTDLREDNEQVSTEMLALQSELCELRRQTDQSQGDPAAPTRYAAAACRAILLPELDRIAQLPSGAYREAMEVLYELSDTLGYACANGGSWPQEATEPDAPMEDAGEDAGEDPGFEEWPGWMHQKWAEEHPEEGDPA